MSAWLCSDAHVYLVAAYAESRGFGDALRIARALRKTNNRALFCLYGNRPARLTSNAGGLARARAALAGVSAGEMHAHVACLEYQCSEGDAMDAPGPSELGAAHIRGLLGLFEREGTPMTGGVWGYDA